MGTTRCDTRGRLLGNVFAVNDSRGQRGHGR